MSSSNEPGYPRSGDGSSAGGGTPDSPASGASPGSSAARTEAPPPGPAPSAAGTHGDAPPWQRGPGARAKAQHQKPDAPPGADRAAAAGLDARLNRFISGAPATPASPETGSTTRGERTEVARTEVARTDVARVEGTSHGEGASAAYRSELPDLSDAPPRPPQQRKPVDRPPAEQPSTPPAPASGAIGRAVQVAVRQHKGPVRASMQIRRIDPWSALKVSLVLSVAMFFVWMIAVAFLYLVLGGMGVWSKLNSNVGDLLTSASGSAGGELVSSGTIFGGAALIGLVNIVLLTAAATIGTFIYNLTTDLVGGVEVTLADRD